MTDTNSAGLSGEERLKNRRRAYWKYIGRAMGIAFVAGTVGGVLAILAVKGVVPAWVLYPLTGAALIAFAWFSYDYFRRIDELDLLDNLWATTVGFYVYFALEICWLLFNRAGLTPPPDDIAVLGISMLALVLTYGWRKLRWN
ncbi:MAG: hypothetical protein ACR2PC_17310 [Tsuneonella suprasediminis]|nr:hypothetical protein LBX01_11600 [Altererythrobacter sp. N1]